MIKQLYIKNYAIIDSVHLDLSDQLTVITGETGAGKSILIGALSLILGDRADSNTLYDKDKKCIVEGVFDISKYHLKPIFDDRDLDYDDELIIRREIRQNGKSRAFVNDSPTTLKDLRRISHQIIDLHRQFDTQDIHQMSFQLKTLDALSEQKKQVKGYNRKYQEWQKAKSELNELISQRSRHHQEQDFIAFQLEEIEKLEIEEGETAQLERERDFLAHAEDLKSAYQQTGQYIEEQETSVISILNELIHQFEKTDSAGEDIRNRLESVRIELEDIVMEAQSQTDEIDWDPAKLEIVNERLDKIYQLCKKHQVEDPDELIFIKNSLSEKLGEFGQKEEQIEKLQRNCDELEKELKKEAIKLSNRRKEIAPQLENKVLNQLEKVAIPKANFKVSIHLKEEIGPAGIDEVDFLFSANKGMEPMPIRKVASGGELSRLAFAIKSIVADAIPLPSLVFDEIDSGISGDVALKMGEILLELSRKHQVIVITHSPQVAAQGDLHYLVFKNHQGERTFTNVKVIEGDQREHAIAVMLSSEPPSPAARENAKDLLSMKKKYQEHEQ